MGPIRDPWLPPEGNSGVLLMQACSPVRGSLWLPRALLKAGVERTTLTKDASITNFQTWELPRTTQIYLVELVCAWSGLNLGANRLLKAPVNATCTTKQSESHLY